MLIVIAITTYAMGSGPILPIRELLLSLEMNVSYRVSEVKKLSSSFLCSLCQTYAAGPTVKSEFRHSILKP
jgi:hypothetical protein